MIHCPDGQTVPSGGTCPNKQCPDGQSVPNGGSCPDKPCPGGGAVPNGGTCPNQPPVAYDEDCYIHDIGSAGQYALCYFSGDYDPDGSIVDSTVSYNGTHGNVGCGGTTLYCTYWLHGSYWQMGGDGYNPIEDSFGYCVVDNGGAQACATVYLHWYPS